MKIRTVAEVGLTSYLIITAWMLAEHLHSWGFWLFEACYAVALVALGYLGDLAKKGDN